MYCNLSLVSQLPSKLHNSFDKPSYFGRTYPDMPNYFISIGPNGPLSHGSAITTVEKGVDWAVAAIQKIRHDNIKYIAVKLEAYDDFNEFQKIWLQVLKKIK